MIYQINIINYEARLYLEIGIDGCKFIIEHTFAMTIFIFNSVAIITVLVSLFILFQKKLRVSKIWRAMMTPLASIIGSGFLISAPLLLLATGRWALLVMIVIVLLAYALGSSIRFNIQYVEPNLNNPSAFPWTNRIETLARPILGIAYIISVTFYLKLLSVFALRGIGLSNPIYENSLTTLLLLFIGIMGKLRGLSILEVLETYSVNTKLAIVFSLLITHFLYNADLLAKGLWVVKIYPHESWWMGFRKVLGMLIIIQGFETSRYLAHAYKAAIRIRTMRYAQWTSGAIYILFVALTTVLFNNIHQINEATVIDLCRIVAPVLPGLLIIAAIMSQFSAAVADTAGSGGLLSEATKKRITVNNSYLLISLIAVTLTWITNVFEIITIASKAFALYYALQASISLITLSSQQHDVKYRVLKQLLFGFLIGLMLLVIAIGIPVD